MIKTVNAGARPINMRMPGSKIKTAVVFWRLGPYHNARLNAAGKLMQVYALETCGTDTIYAWEKVGGAENFERITLTDRCSNTRQWREEFRQRMFKELDNIQPDVVAIPGWSLDDALAALSWCVHRKTPVVVMSESTEWDEARAGWKEWVKRKLVGLCSAALVGGNPQKNYMVKLGMPAERIFLGYDAVDNGYFAENAEKLKTETLKTEGAKEVRSREPEVRKKYGLPEKYFLASARFIEKKNLARLLQAYARYRKNAETLKAEMLKSEGRKKESRKQKMENKNEFQFSDFSVSAFDPWSLVLLGDGVLRSSLESQVSSLGLQHCVHLPGFKQYPDLPAYYARAGAFIHASTTEQWGLVVNEALRLRGGFGAGRRERFHIRSFQCRTTRATHASGFRFPISDFRFWRRQRRHHF
jgi:glycosyltransferase involved in cell wall biosynthesis